MTAAFGTIGTEVAYPGPRNATVVPLPADLVPGEHMLCPLFVLSNVDPEAPTIPTGWALAPGTWPITLTASGAIGDCYLYEKISEEDEPVPSWGHGGNRNSQGVIIRSTGIDADTSFDVVPSQNSGTGTTTTFLSITTVTDGALIYAIDWDFGDNTTDQAPPSGSTPTFTDRLEVTLTAVASGVQTTHGATGNKTRTNHNNGAGGPFGSVLVALRPAGAGPAAAPSYSVAPVIAGTAVEGETLTRTAAGTASGNPTPTITGKWQRSDNGSTGWTDIDGATATTYVLQTADVTKHIRYLETATNTEGNASSPSNVIGAVAAAPPLDFSVRLSGGAANASPTASIGGARSSVEYTAENLFDDSARTEYVDGHTDYRIVYVSNDDTGDATVTASVTDDSAGVAFAVGVPTQAAGVAVTALANDETAPGSVTFSAGPVDLGAIPGGSYRGLHIRRTISAGAAANPNVGWEVTLEVTPT